MVLSIRQRQGLRKACGLAAATHTFSVVGVLRCRAGRTTYEEASRPSVHRTGAAGIVILGLQGS